MKQDIPDIKGQGGTIPALGLGTWKVHGDTGRRAVLEALGLGYRHIDTAQMYQNEDVVGRAVAESDVDRGEVFITTKVAPGDLDARSVRSTCVASLERLRTDHIDLFLIHWPDASIPLEETLGEMAALREEGKVRHVGVSNFPTALLERALVAADVPIFCNQIEYHPYLSQEPVLSSCRDNGIAVVAYSPLAEGAAARDERLAEIGKRYDKTAAQVALRWLIQQPGVATIPKSSNVHRLGENLDIFDFELSEEDVSRIDSLEKNRRVIDPSWSPRWDT